MGRVPCVYGYNAATGMVPFSIGVRVRSCWGLDPFALWPQVEAGAAAEPAPVPSSPDKEQEDALSDSAPPGGPE